MESHTTTKKPLTHDRLSTLPDALLVTILSLLPLKLAATTSTLSTRYLNLWTQITHLSFATKDSIILPSDNPSSPSWHIFNTHESFFNTITSILSQLTTSKLTSFSLSPPYPPSDSSWVPYTSTVASWLRNVCSSNFNVERIKIRVDIPSPRQPFFPLPGCLFACPSLVELELGFGVEYTVSDGVRFFLPKLRKLKMNIYDSHRGIMGCLFKSSSVPLLEDLEISALLNEGDHVINVQSDTLKRLVVVGYGYSEGTRFLIDAPNLDVVDFSFSMSVGEYVFVRRPIKLRKAVVCLSVDRQDQRGGDGSFYAGQMLRLVRNVCGARIVHFGGAATFKPLHCIGVDSLPSFDNLKCIVMPIGSVDSWNDLFLIVRLAPNVEVLNMFDATMRTEGESVWVVPECIPESFWSKIKQIEISRTEPNAQTLIFLKYILRCSTALEQLVFEAAVPDLCANGAVELIKMLKFCKTLFSLHKASTACEISFSQRYLTATSKDFKNGSLDCRIEGLNSIFFFSDLNCPAEISSNLPV